MTRSVWMLGLLPVAMAVVKATATELANPAILTHVQKLDASFRRLTEVSGVEQVHGAGCLIGLRTKLPAKQLKDLLLAHRIITGTSKDPYVLRLLPPIVLEEEHVEHFKSILQESLA